MTHDDLVKRASTWLKNSRGCSIVASDLVTAGMETPDVIGWNGWGSILIEAKISVSDFRADQKKTFRMAGRGMGMRRYYIVPFELEEKVLPLLPERWGLLLWRSTHLMVAQESDLFESDKNSEILFLSSVIRRIAGSAQPLKGMAVRCYTIDIPNPKAELFIEPEVV